MTVIVGVIADRLGHVRTSAVVDTPLGRRTFVERGVGVPAHAYRTAQPGYIAVDLEHTDPPIGHVVALELAGDGKLWATAVVHLDDLGDGLYFSPEVRHQAGRSGVLERLALTRAPATVALPAVTVLPGDLADAIRRTPYSPIRQRMQRALDDERHRGPGAIEVRTVDSERPVLEARTDRRPNVPIEYGSSAGTRILSVRR